MKAIFLIFILTHLTISVYSQNEVPKILKKNVYFNTIDKIVSVDFDLIDPDNVNLEVQCHVYSISENSKYEELIVHSILGDIGYPIKPGSDKNIQLFDIALSDPKFLIILSVNDREPINIHDVISKVNPENLKYHILKLQGKRNSQNSSIYYQGRKYCEDFMEKYIVPNTLEFQNAPYSGINYESTQYGTSIPSSVQIIDAHYDSALNSPGADDNASGVAGVLEAMRILSSYSSKKTIRYILFDLEENGLVGSNIYLASQISKKDNIQSVINFEMIGYYSELVNSQDFPSGFNLLFPEAYNQVIANNRKGDFIINVGNTNSFNLKNSFHLQTINYVPELKIISLEVPGNGSIAQDLRRSDHASFWDKNIPALMITDGANFRNKNYHTIRDSIDYLDFNFMSNVVKASVATLCDIAEIEHGSSIQIALDASTNSNTGNQFDFESICKEGCILIKPNNTFSNVKISVYDLKGTEVFSTFSARLDSSFKKLDNTKLATGIYYLSISNQKQRLIKKIFVHE